MNLLRTKVELLHESGKERVAASVAGQLVSQPGLPYGELRLRIALWHSNGNERLFGIQRFGAGREQNRAHAPGYFERVLLAVNMVRLAAVGAARVGTVEVIGARKQHRFPLEQAVTGLAFGRQRRHPGRIDCIESDSNPRAQVTRKRLCRSWLAAHQIRGGYAVALFPGAQPVLEPVDDFVLRGAEGRDIVHPSEKRAGLFVEEVDADQIAADPAIEA